MQEIDANRKRMTRAIKKKHKADKYMYLLWLWTTD